MNIEELRIAVDRWDTPISIEELLPHAEDIVLFVEAARRWLNPNIKAAAEELRRWFLDGDSMYELEAKRLIAAAFTPQGDTK